MAERTCRVIFDDGTLCARPVNAYGLCLACRNWQRRRGGVDPNGRKDRRRNGEMLRLLTAAASASQEGCLVLGGYLQRPQIHVSGKWTNAARFVWIIANDGRAPGPDVVIRHTCHNELCVNIGHLIPGSNADNSRDKVIAGRQSRGESHPYCVLTDDQVREIRRRYQKRRGVGALAAEYGVTRKYVWAIANRKSRMDVR